MSAFDANAIVQINNKIENGTNNGDITTNYYSSENEMAALIDTMVSYESDGDGAATADAAADGFMETNFMELKPLFKSEEVAATTERIIIQQKYPSPKEECSICLSSLFHKQVAYLPCKHYFHSACLTNAFTNKLYTCPLCRTDLTSVLKKIGFEFPPAEPAPLSDLDLDIIYRLLESSVYYPYTFANTDTNYRYFPLLHLYQIEFNATDIDQMFSIIERDYGVVGIDGIDGAD